MFDLHLLDREFYVHVIIVLYYVFVPRTYQLLLDNIYNKCTLFQTNTFQAILTTDYKQSRLFTLYDPEGMRWIPLTKYARILYTL